jgi:Flp pilus assembly protein TadG
MWDVTPRKLNMKLQLIRRLKPRTTTAHGTTMVETLQRQGAAALEFAICLPMLMLITFGIIETCDAIFLKQSLILAAQEGARVAVVPNATATNVTTQVQNILSARGVQHESITISPNNFTTAPFGSMITVNVIARIDQNSNSYLGLMTGRRINGSCTMMMERN